MQILLSMVPCSNSIALLLQFMAKFPKIQLRFVEPRFGDYTRMFTIYQLVQDFATIHQWLWKIHEHGQFLVDLPINNHAFPQLYPLDYQSACYKSGECDYISVLLGIVFRPTLPNAHTFRLYCSGRGGWTCHVNSSQLFAVHACQFKQGI